MLDTLSMDSLGIKLYANDQDSLETNGGSHSLSLSRNFTQPCFHQFYSQIIKHFPLRYHMFLRELSVNILTSKR